ncbi:hypothetical protein [Paractinoplanes maris]|uniref:hypothetical protein n=1 Tax=Paractinoplanes maris TaxID=1734446 RepID=UPI00201FE326|nr:hypothetical protein [Actinoplanes maris]
MATTNKGGGTGGLRRRLVRAIATVTVLTGAMVVGLATPALAAEEFNYFNTAYGVREADYKITFYGAPSGQHRKHLVIADKKADGKAPLLRIWPAPLEDPCYYIDYADKGGSGDGAYHYDIYYPVSMIAYVLADREGAWGGQYGLNGQWIINARRAAGC